MGISERAVRMRNLNSSTRRNKPVSTGRRASSRLWSDDDWIAILIDTSTTWSRQIVEGAITFTKRYTRWKIFVEARGIEEYLQVPKELRCKGVIARVNSEKMVKDLVALDVPVVNVSGIGFGNGVFPQVTTYTRKVADLAVEHFLEKGFSHFAYFGLEGLPYVTAQQNEFEAKVQEMGFDCASFREETHRGTEPDWSGNAKLLAWLQSLPKPTGIFTWNVSSARELLYACLGANLRVPDDVAVLIGSEEELLFEASPVPISAVLPATKLIGFRAAELLNRLIQGEKVPSAPTLISPLGVVTRQSTDTLAVKDPAVARALAFLWKNREKPIQVEDLARQAGLSRRALERRFREVLKRSPADEIRRGRLDSARRLLAETDLPISAVAEALGFATQAYFAYLHTRYYGQSPSQYRSECRPG
jgi:LacI family transcriptional regulator